MSDRLDSEVYAQRRSAFLQAMGPGGVAVLHAPPEPSFGRQRFRQSSDIYYLTGFAEPDATCVLRADASEPFVLFVRPRNKERETWDGRRAGVEGAVAHFGANAAYPTAELTARLPELLANTTELHYGLGVDHGFDRVITRALATLRATERRGQAPPYRVVDPRLALHEMRLRKRPEEVALLRQAVAITAEAHLAAMAAAGPGVAEYELESLIDYTFRRRGGAGPGYSTIVGSGANATVLHYIENESLMTEGDLVVIDAGCEYGFYTADVTRTFPVSGSFSAVQRRLYDLVLAVQEQAIAMTRPGVTIDDIHERCVRALTEGMVELGLLEGPAPARVTDKSYERFYMHRTSHWLGMDVHDVGAYLGSDRRIRPLEPGMVITIEPGLYIAADAEGVPADMRGIGIRIEDDILVTKDGCEVLSAMIPKQPDEIELACRRPAHGTP